MATKCSAVLRGDRLSLVFYPANDVLDGVNASVRLTREEVCDLLRAIDEAMPDAAPTLAETTQP